MTAETRSSVMLDPQNPYAGPHWFAEADHDYFHGRKSEATSLLQMVKRAGLTVLYGRSGLGKTSLLEAGLFPELRKNGFWPVRLHLDIAAADHVLTDQVYELLAAAARRDAIVIEAPGEEGQTLWEYFHRVSCADKGGRPVKPVLAFDQFEEIFTLGARRQKAVEPFLNELSDLVENRIPEVVRKRLEAREVEGAEDEDERGDELPPSYETPKIKVILALREDYLPHLDDLRKRMPSLASSRYRLLPLNARLALDAVLTPATMLPGREIIDRSVAVEVVRYAAAETPEQAGGAGHPDTADVDPALLSLLCSELNRSRLARGADKISFEQFVAEREKVFKEFYKNCVRGLGRRVPLFIEDQLLEGHRYRRQMNVHVATHEYGIAGADIDELIKRRLLHPEAHGTERLIEIVHDVMVKPIREERDRRIWRNKLLLGIGAPCALAVLILGTFFTLSWLRQRERAKIAHDQLPALLEVGRQKLAEGDTVTAVRILVPADSLARELDSESYPDELRLMMARMFKESRGIIATRDTMRGSIKSLVYSPDGGRVAVLSEDGALTLWGLADGSLAGEPLILHENAPVSKKQKEQEGGGASAGAATMDQPRPMTSARVMKKGTLEGALSDVTFDGTGALLAGVNAQGRGAVWSVANGQVLNVFETHFACQGEALPWESASSPRVLLSHSGDWVAVWWTDSSCAVAFPVEGDGLTDSLQSVFDLGDERLLAVSFLSAPRGGPVLINVAGGDGKVRQWNAETDDREEVTHLGLNYEVVRFAPDGSRISAISGGVPRVWSLLERDPQPQRLVGHGASIVDARFAPGVDGVLVTMDNQTGLQEWDVKQRKIKAELPPVRGSSGSRRFGFGTLPFSVAPGGGSAATGDTMGLLRVWQLSPKDVSTHERILSEGHSVGGDPLLEEESGSCWSLRGKRRVVVGCRPDRTISLVDVLPEQKGKTQVPARIEVKRELRNIEMGPTGRYVVEVDQKGDAFLRDLDGNEDPRSLRSRKASENPLGVQLALFSRDERWLALWDSDRLYLCTTEKGRVKQDQDAGGAGAECRRVPHEKRRVTAVDFDPDGTHLAVGDSGGGLSIYETGSLSSTWEERDAHEISIRSVAFHVDGKRLLSASMDGTVAVWSSGDALVKLEHEPSPRAALDARGERILTIGSDGVASIWGIDGRAVCSLPKQDAVIRGLFSPDGERVLTFGARDARLWNVRDCTLSQPPMREPNDSMRDATFSEDGKTVITIWASSGVRSFSALAEVTTRRLGPSLGHHWAPIVTAALDGPWLYTRDERGSVRAWSFLQGESPIVGQGWDLEGVVQPGLSQGGEWTLAAGADGSVVLWAGGRLDVREGALSGGPPLLAAVLSPTGQQLLTVDADLRVGLRSVPGLVATTKPAQMEGAKALKGAFYLETGPIVVTTDADERLLVWRGSGGAVVLDSKACSAEDVSTIAVSPDGKWLAAGWKDGAAGLLSIDEKKCAPLKGHQRTVVTAAFNHDATMLVTASQDGTARLWSTKGDLKAILKRHSRPLTGAGFQPGRSFLTTASEDGSVWLWNARDGTPLARLYGHQNGVKFAGITRDGEHLVTAGVDGWIRVWDMVLDPRESSEVASLFKRYLPR